MRNVHALHSPQETNRVRVRVRVRVGNRVALLGDDEKFGVHGQWRLPGFDRGLRILLGLGLG